MLEQNTLLCRSQLLERIPVSPPTLDKLLRLGVLPPPRTLGGRRFWSEAKVSAAIRALPVAHGEPYAVTDPPASEYALSLTGLLLVLPIRSKNTVKKLVASGELPGCRRLGERRVVWIQSEVEQCLRNIYD